MSNAAAHDLPFVTVVMPIRNEEAFIARSLGAVLAQDYPPDKVEVLIADGMSDDHTAEVIHSLPNSERVRIIPNPDRIQAAGLNLAMKQARGEYVIRVDGHTIIAPDYVRCCVEALQATGAHNVGGPMDPVGLTPMGKAIAAAGKSPFAVPSAFHVSQTAQFTDTVYMGAWPKQVLDAVGYFDSGYAINEDYELNVRIRQAGGQIYLSPDIRCAYYGRQTLGALTRQYYRYGKGKVATLRKHPGSLKSRHLVAPLFVAGLAVGCLLSLIFPWARVLWLAGIVAYAAAALLFSYRIASKTDMRLLWRLPLVFAAMHLTWGAGFWVGLARSFLSPTA